MQEIQYKGKTRRLTKGAKIIITDDIFMVKEEVYTLDWKTYDRTAGVAFSMFINVKHLKNIDMVYLGNKGDRKVYVVR